MKRTMRTGLAFFSGAMLALPLIAAEPIPMPPRWRGLAEALNEAAPHDAGTRFALPGGVGGNVFVGEAGVERDPAAWAQVAAEAGGFTWLSVPRGDSAVWIAHRPDDKGLARWSESLAGEDEAAAVEAAWRLGWSRDARAVRPLAQACLDVRLPVALAAAAALERLAGEGRPQPMTLSDDIRAGNAAAPEVREDWRLRFWTHRPRRLPLTAAWSDLADADAVRRLLASPYVPLRRAGVRLSVALPEAAAFLAEAQQDAAPAVSEPARVLAAILEAGPDTVRELDDLPDSEALAEAIQGVKEGRRPDVLRGYRTLLPAVLAHDPTTTEAVIQAALRQIKTVDSLTTRGAGSVLRFSGGEKVVAALSQAVQEGYEQRRADPWPFAVALEQLMTDGTAFYEAVGGAAILTGGNRDQGGGAYMLARHAPGNLDRVVSDLAEAAVGDDVGAYRAAEALGFVGGPQATAHLAAAVQREIPKIGGRKNYHEASVHFAAAKALGEAGTADALAALLAMAGHEHHLLRWSAVLGLREIGGPDAVARLGELMTNDPMRLVRAAAADALTEIDRAGSAKAVAAFRAADAGAGRRSAFQPRNPKLDAMPVGEWVRLDFGLPHSGHGGHEVSWDYDVANRLFFRIGGCGHFYGNSIFAIDIGTEMVVMVRPNDWWSGWHGLMPSPGCCGGRVYDPDRQVIWFGPVTSAGHGTGVYAASLGSYHPATDRIAAVPAEARQGIGRTRHIAYDSERQWLVPLGPTRHGMRIFDIRENLAVNFGQTGFPYNRNGDGAVVGFYNPLNKTYYLTGRQRDGGDFETYVFDHGERKWSLLTMETPNMTSGAGAYDPYHKVRYLTGQLRNQDTTFWVFDLANPKWTQMPIEAPSALHAHTSRNSDFDPEHNALIVFGGWSWAVHAFRYKDIPEGTVAEY